MHEPDHLLFFKVDDLHISRYEEVSVFHLPCSYILSIPLSHYVQSFFVLLCLQVPRFVPELKKNLECWILLRLLVIVCHLFISLSCIILSLFLEDVYLQEQEPGQHKELSELLDKTILLVFFQQDFGQVMTKLAQDGLNHIKGVFLEVLIKVERLKLSIIFSHSLFSALLLLYLHELLKECIKHDLETFASANEFLLHVAHVVVRQDVHEDKDTDVLLPVVDQESSINEVLELL